MPIPQAILERIEISARERNIEALVYEIYDLTPKEIAVIEAATAPAVIKEDSVVADESTPAAVAYDAEATAKAAHHYFANEDPVKED